MSKEDKLIKEQNKRFKDENERFKFFIKEKESQFSALKVPTGDILFDLAYESASQIIRGPLGIIRIPEQYDTETALSSLAAAISNSTVSTYNTLKIGDASNLILNYPNAFTTREFEEFADKQLQVVNLKYRFLKLLADDYLSTGITDDFKEEVAKTNLEGLNSIGWIDGALESLKYKYASLVLGLNATTPYSNARVSEEFDKSLSLNLSKNAPFRKKKSGEPSTINLPESTTKSVSKSPINETGSKLPEKEVSSTINPATPSTSEKSESITQSSVTSGTIELPKEPEVAKEQPTINISLENKEKPQVVTPNTTTVNSPINENSESSSVTNVSNTQSNISSNINENLVTIQNNISNPTNEPATPLAAGTNTVNESSVENTSTFKLPEAFSTSQISKVYDTVSRYVKTDTSAINPIVSNTSTKAKKQGDVKKNTSAINPVGSDEITKKKKQVDLKELLSVVSTSINEINSTNAAKSINLGNTTNLSNTLNEGSELSASNSINETSISNTPSSINETSISNTPSSINTSGISNVSNAITSNQVAPVPSSINETNKTSVSNNSRSINETSISNTPSSINETTVSNNPRLINETRATNASSSINEANKTAVSNAMSNESVNRSTVSNLNDILNSTTNKNESSIKIEGSKLNIPLGNKLNQTEVTKSLPTFSEKIKSASIPSQTTTLEEKNVISTSDVTNTLVPTEKTNVSSTSEKIEKTEPANTQPMTTQYIDISPLEQRLARLEYLLSNTLEVKIID